MAPNPLEHLSRRTRRLLMVGAAFEGTLKAAALVDIARRPASEIKGPKAAWVVAIILVNSVGALPVSYFLFARSKPAH